MEPTSRQDGSGTQEPPGAAPPASPGTSPDQDATAGSLLRLRSQWRGADVVVVAADGEIDMLTAPTLRDELAGHQSAGARVVVVDLGGVGFLASSGLAVLVTAHSELAARGAQLRLVVRNRAVSRPLALTGLTTALALYPDLPAALADPPPSAN
ncbi:STAS domain-containing protein [Streptoalloteichus hindustanus]|uniref:Anti-sigma factor antagonist n=1 Tax=Streptoalloteichus hindustanus TaxID=2017 RepID=A0A1M4Y8L6_STRHI|nr:STAS domain-containing protein [Streptoalloteichus hindustanus]SHF02085.1 anti-anti-sigma factor [Streptoalloteichus hindustanus]